MPPGLCAVGPGGCEASYPQSLLVGERWRVARVTCVSAGEHTSGGHPQMNPGITPELTLGYARLLDAAAMLRREAAEPCDASRYRGSFSGSVRIDAAVDACAVEIARCHEALRRRILRAAQGAERAVADLRQRDRLISRPLGTPDAP